MAGIRGSQTAPSPPGFALKTRRRRFKPGAEKLALDPFRGAAFSPLGDAFARGLDGERGQFSSWSVGGLGEPRLSWTAVSCRIDEDLLGDGHSYSPKAIHSWLTRVMYNHRSKLNPLWNTVVIGGYSHGEG